MFEKIINDLFDYYMGFGIHSLRKLDDASMNEIIESLQNNDYSVEQITDMLREESGHRKHYIKSHFLNTELESKVEEALKVLKLEKLLAFKKAVNDGTYEEFLSSLDIYDRMSIRSTMWLYEDDTPSKNNIYGKIISEAVEEEIDRIGTRFMTPEEKLVYMLRDSLGLTNQKKSSTTKKVRKLSKDE